MATDERKVTLLSLLHMSAAFDCDGLLILLQRLQVEDDIRDTALDWIRSFLSGRTQQVLLLGGVPQGTVLGPLLYILYTAPLSHIIA